VSGGPLLVVLAGPNGAGKSTFYELYLRELGLRFINADIIARSLAPTGPGESSGEAGGAAYRAAQVADAARRALLAMGESFCMETVFSDPVGAKLAFLREAREAGYRVVLHFIGLASPELSQARVVHRVLNGGHDVPDEKLFARYPRTLENLARAASQVDALLLYDNSSAAEPYRLLGRLERGEVVERHPPVPEWAHAVLPDG
jgi:predicted ABC-type ATPase